MRVYKDQKFGAKIKAAQPVKYLLVMLWRPSTHISVLMLIISPPPSVNKSWPEIEKSFISVRNKGGIIKCILIFDPEAIKPDALAVRKLIVDDN